MIKNRTFIILSLFVILMTVFGSALAQESAMPAIRIHEVVPDEKVVLTTKDFPGNTDYVVGMGSPEDEHTYIAVAKFNSNEGGSIHVTVKIPEAYRGLERINLLLKDENGNKILGSFENISYQGPVAVPVELVNDFEPAEETPAEETPAEETPAEETPAEETPAEETPAEETPAEETPAEETPAEETPAEETPAEEAPADEVPADETPAEEAPAETPVEEVPAEKTPAEEVPADETPAEEVPAEEVPAEETPAEETPVEEVPAEEGPAEVTAEEITADAVSDEYATAGIPFPVCNFSVIPTVTIDAVTRNQSVTFTTYNFPADSTFSVSMGTYVASWKPAPMAPRYPYPHPHYHGPAPHPGYAHDVDGVYFYPIDDPYSHPAPGFGHPGPHHPAPRPQAPAAVPVFSGTQIGTFETGDGTPQTLTFTIPSSLYGVNPIALWISDLGPCGFYSYNYFYNNSTL